MKTWEELKQQGSSHYRTDGVQPVDLYRDLGVFRNWALVEICQHAIRNLGTGKPEDSPVSNKDMRKIIDYAEKLMAAEGTEEPKPRPVHTLTNWGDWETYEPEFTE